VGTWFLKNCGLYPGQHNVTGDLAGVFPRTVRSPHHYDARLPRAPADSICVVCVPSCPWIGLRAGFAQPVRATRDRYTEQLPIGFLAPRAQSPPRPKTQFPTVSDPEAMSTKEASASFPDKAFFYFRGEMARSGSRPFDEVVAAEGLPSMGRRAV